MKNLRHTAMTITAHTGTITKRKERGNNKWYVNISICMMSLGNKDKVDKEIKWKKRVKAK